MAKQIIDFRRHYEDMDEARKKQITAQFFADRELIDSAMAKARNKVYKGGLKAQETRAERAEKIVNEYGQAILTGIEQNHSIIDKFTEKLNADLVKSFNEKKAIYYRFKGYLDIRFLPHSKETIREAIDFLLWWFLHIEGIDETDSRIELLVGGLLMINDFIDLSHIPIEEPKTTPPVIRVRGQIRTFIDESSKVLCFLFCLLPVLFRV